jgi:putative phosphoesterase
MQSQSLRIAVLSDIHGNDLALEAVLTDSAASGGVDEFWILGDLAAIGPAPIRTLERLAGLSMHTRKPVQFIRGNTDRYLCTGERPGPDLAAAQADPEQMNLILEIAANFAWTRGAVAVSGWLDWLNELPLEYRTRLPDGTRVLCVHAAPGVDDGAGILASDEPDSVASLLAGCEADLVCVGHTHQPFSLQVGEVQVINPGSLSNPFGPDVRASYALIHADEHGYRVEHRRVDYDQAAVIAEARRLGHPAADLIARRLGEGS